MERESTLVIRKLDKTLEIYVNYNNVSVSDRDVNVRALVDSFDLKNSQATGEWTPIQNGTILSFGGDALPFLKKYCCGGMLQLMFLDAKSNLVLATFDTTALVDTYNDMIK